MILLAANIGQVSFEAVAQIVKRLQNILDLKSDRHGHKCLLTTYIEYSCTLPHPELHQPREPSHQLLAVCLPGSLLCCVNLSTYHCTTHTVLSFITRLL